MQRSRSLRRGREFDTAYREGTVVNGPLFVVRYRANDAGRTRWGFAVGRRLAKKSVDRNRVRRRLREAARPLPVRDGYDVIVTAKQGALRAKLPELAGQLTRSLRKAGLLEDHA